MSAAQSLSDDVQSPPASAEPESDAQASRSFLRTLTCTAAVALVCKLWLARSTFGTNDVYAYEKFAAWAGYLGSGIYRAAWDFNHPPSMIPVLRGLAWLARTTGLFFPFWLRLLPTLADAGSVVLAYRLARPHLDETRTRLGLLLLAASPTLIQISGFHGNTDSVMIFLLLLSVYWTDRRGDFPAGMAFGLSACVKIVPVITLPALLLYRPGAQRKLRFLAAAALTVGLCWIPWMLPDPRQVISQVLGYRGQYGLWGLSWLSWSVFGHDDLPNQVLKAAGPYALLGAEAILAFRMVRLPNKPSLYTQVGLSLCFFLAASPAFGVQYLAWVVPWTIGWELGPVLFQAIASASFLVVVYDHWASGLPWYLADSNSIGSFRGHADYFQLVCWASVLLLTWSAWLRVNGRAPGLERLEQAAPRVHGAFAAALAMGLILPCTLQVASDMRKGHGNGGRELLPGIRAKADIDLSAVLVNGGQAAEGVEVAQRAVAALPHSALAWNNLAAGYAAERDWDAAIHAATEALGRDPRFTLARNNLHWAIQEKAKAAKALLPEAQPAAIHTQTLATP